MVVIDDVENEAGRHGGGRPRARSTSEVHSEERLKLYTIYSPPEHQDQLVRRPQSDDNETRRKADGTLAISNNCYPLSLILGFILTIN
jgi:hypothetical protein